MPDEHHQAFCISGPDVAAHGYKLPRILLPFPGPAPGLLGARVKFHFSGSCLPAQPAHYGSSHNHRSLNRLFRFFHRLTYKVATVLHSSVRVMYKRTCRFSSPQRLSERFNQVFCLQVFPDMVTHDFSGAGIGDQTQIGRAAA